MSRNMNREKIRQTTLLIHSISVLTNIQNVFTLISMKSNFLLMSTLSTETKQITDYFTI